MRGMNPEDFIENDILNPFARICCKTRKITPTLCDGTCRDCKIARDTYLLTEPSRIIGTDLMRNG